MVVPPQGVGGAPPDAGALEDSYIALFKAKDMRVARIFEFAELLVNAGKLTFNEVVTYANDVLSADYVADVLQRRFSTDFAASILENVSFDKAVSIVNSDNLSVPKLASIFDNANLSVSRAYSILANGSLSADRVQSILYYMTFATKLIDILTYGAVDLTVSANMSISGVNRYRTLTVNSGVTLTITGQPGALIVKTLNNKGTIAKSATGGAGGNPGTSGCGAGGAGGGGLVIFVDSLVNSGVISADGTSGGNGSTVGASASGGSGRSGVFIRVGADVAGTGGYGGNYSGVSFSPGGVNGGGGGGYSSTEQGGAGDGSSYINFTYYADLIRSINQSMIDWFIVNVLGKFPTSTQSIPNAYGSGGGGGGAYDGYCAGGGGGGGGGEILALCMSLNNTGTIRANGGNGGNGGNEGNYDTCGGGGGGGIVYVLYKTLVASGTIVADGGTHGATADKHGANGSAGTAKAVAI